jgi:hypothetical protein
MKLRITHVAQVPDEIAMHIEHHILDRPFIPPPLELLQPFSDELLAIEISLVYLL